jgi:hypothetical protein
MTCCPLRSLSIPSKAGSISRGLAGQIRLASIMGRRKCGASSIRGCRTRRETVPGGPDDGSRTRPAGKGNAASVPVDRVPDDVAETDPRYPSRALGVFVLMPVKANLLADLVRRVRKRHHAVCAIGLEVADEAPVSGREC